MRLSQREIAEAVVQYLAVRGIVAKDVTFAWQWPWTSAELLSASIDIDQPPKDGPYR